MPPQERNLDNLPPESIAADFLRFAWQKSAGGYVDDLRDQIPAADSGADALRDHKDRSNVAAQVNYVTVGPVTTPDPQAFFSVQSPDTCSDSSQTLPNRGFVKEGTGVVIDALVSATGHCDTYIGSTYMWSRWRDISYIYWSQTPAGGSTQNLLYAAANPPPATDLQLYDTRIPGSGNPGTTKYASPVGKWIFTFRGDFASTGCALPTTSNVITQELNVVKCRPKFHDDGYFGPNASPITVYLPSASYWDNAWQSLQDAVASWNGQMPANAQYVAARGACDMGPNCVQVGEDILPVAEYCGYSNASRNDVTKIITGNATLDLRHDWKTVMVPASLRRTFEHELGHPRGLDDYDLASGTAPLCEVADAAMQPEFFCDDADAMDDVTPTDALPAASSVYGGNTRTYCGF